MARDAHVIRCNDSVEFVVVGEISRALAKKEELREEYFQRNRWNFNNSRKKYERICYWNISTVPCEE